MTIEQSTDIVDNILKDYPEILSRGDLAKVLGVSYASVPKEIKEKEVPIMSDNKVGSWNRIKVHKPVLRQYLINKYTKNQEEK